jgi:DNA-binding CsgD family transcriptional regulator
MSSADAAGMLVGGAGFWRREAGLLATVTYAPEWGDRYVEADYVRIDPVLETAQRSFLPVDWKALPWDSRKRKQFLREAIDCGIGNQGYTVPVRGPDGQFALFTVNKNCNDESWASYLRENRGDLMVIAHFFHQKVLEIERIFGPTPLPSLSAREKDVLSMIAAGRARSQVAHDLSISENTLRVYLDSARHKLGALNIPHAVAIGVNRGIVNL